MTIAEMIYQHSLRLPEAQALEVLNFIEFIEQRHAAQDEAKAGDARLAGLTAEQRRAYGYLQTVRIDWNGKPMPDREEANARR